MTGVLPTGDPSDRTVPKQAPRNLTLRIISSAVLIPAALVPILLGGFAFAGLVAFAMLAMIYEWARMVERTSRGPIFWTLTISGLAAFLVAGRVGFLPAYGIVMAGAIGALVAGRSAPERGWGAFGAAYIVAPSVALVWLRTETQNGLALTLILFAAVWATDIAAYFGGRFMGGPKLNPWISPRKTWAGTLTGIGAGAGVAAGLSGAMIPGAPFMLALAGGAGLGAASVVGDIVESAMKRGFGVKDSGRFIPGHGGVLDRLDGMIFATVALALTLAINRLAQGLLG